MEKKKVAFQIGALIWCVCGLAFIIYSVVTHFTFFSEPLKRGSWIAFWLGGTGCAALLLLSVWGVLMILVAPFYGSESKWKSEKTYGFFVLFFSLVVTVAGLVASIGLPNGTVAKVLTTIVSIPCIAFGLAPLWIFYFADTSDLKPLKILVRIFAVFIVLALIAFGVIVALA